MGTNPKWNESQKTVFVFLAITFCLQLLAQNDKIQSVELPPIFSDQIVLQQKSKATLWGSAAPNAEIAVTGSWGKKAKTMIDKNGHWITNIKTPKAEGV